jgi:replicative DNA helicase
MENNIEDGIIGCILLDPECLFEIYNKVKPEMFTSNFCQKVYAKALSMYDLGKPIDPNILANELSDSESPPEVYLNQFKQLIVDTPTSALLNSYADRLVANYQAKRVSLLLRDIDLNPTNIQDTVADIVSKLEDIQLNRKEQCQTLKQIVKKNKDKHFCEDVLKGLDIKTGLDKVDDSIIFVGGDITVIGARPAVGKSAFAAQIAKTVARNGKKVGYFNLEMLDGQIYQRLVASESGISLMRIQRATSFLGDEEKRYNSANDTLENLNIVVSTGSKTVGEIKAICRHQNFDLIIVDYLQLVKSDHRAESKRVEVGEISGEFKALAIDLDVPIILLSQLNRKVEYTQDKEPTMADLKESGDIEQDASNIILMWNLSDDQDLREFKGLKIEKNRMGILMAEALGFEGEKMTFYECKETLDEAKRKLKDSFKKVDDEESPFA